MSLAEHFDTEQQLHHFYLVEGAVSEDVQELSQILATRHNADEAHRRIFSYSTLGVEDAHIIRQAHNETAHDGEAQYFIVNALSVTPEAQQTLLKTFEEPRSKTHFFLVMPDITSILPTVRSRARYVRVSGGETVYTKEADMFIKSSLDARLAFIADFIKQHEDEDDSGALRLHASQFIVALLEVMHKDPQKMLQKQQVFRDALEFRGYLDSRGASVKMILEHLALVV